VGSLPTPSAKRAEERPLAAGGNPGKHCPAQPKCNLCGEKRKMRQRAKTCWSVLSTGSIL